MGKVLRFPKKPGSKGMLEINYEAYLKAQRRRKIDFILCLILAALVAVAFGFIIRKYGG